MGSKTFWCTKCNRFAISSGGQVPSCPVHGRTMVDNPSDPRRIEGDAPSDDPRRKRRFSRVYNAEETLRKTRSLKAVTSGRPIPVVSNREDDDLRHEVVMGLLIRGRETAISIPEPRHTWNGSLDPDWLRKFQRVLKDCEVAVYARRRGSPPNPATEQELEFLRKANKKVVVYEQGS